MKKLILLAFTFVLPVLSLAAGGTVIGNGGDANEPIFKDIAGNIAGWIQSGNADQIQLPAAIPLDLYKQKMLAALGNYNIVFTLDKITVGEAEKMCRNYVDVANQFQIECNSASFSLAYKNNINDVYRLVHHEFAGLAGLEVNQGEKSDYTISSQISAYLQMENVKRLPIIKSESGPTVHASAKFGDRGSFILWGTCKNNESLVYVSFDNANIGQAKKSELGSGNLFVPCVKHQWIFNEAFWRPGYPNGNVVAVQDGQYGAPLVVNNLNLSSEKPADLVCDQPYTWSYEFNNFFGNEACMPVARCANGRPYIYQDRKLYYSYCTHRKFNARPSPAPPQIVVQAEIKLFSDPEVTTLNSEIKGVKILDPMSGRSNVLPTKANYTVGEKVTLKWCHGSAWGPLWYIDTKTQLPVLAFSSSEEFVGSNIDSGEPDNDRFCH